MPMNIWIVQGQSERRNDINIAAISNTVHDGSPKYNDRFPHSAFLVRFGYGLKAEQRLGFLKG